MPGENGTPLFGAVADRNYGIEVLPDELVCEFRILAGDVNREGFSRALLGKPLAEMNPARTS
jgi:hypothetical protein